MLLDASNAVAFASYERDASIRSVISVMIFTLGYVTYPFSSASGCHGSYTSSIGVSVSLTMAVALTPLPTPLLVASKISLNVLMP